VLQCVAACCSVLQRVAVCCSVLQCVAVCCSVVQCFSVLLCSSGHGPRRRRLVAYHQNKKLVAAPRLIRMPSKTSYYDALYIYVVKNKMLWHICAICPHPYAITTSCYNRFYWKCYACEIHQIEKLKFLGINSNETNISIWICTARYWGIWVFRFGWFRRCSFFSRNCHLTHSYIKQVLMTRFIPQKQMWHASFKSMTRHIPESWHVIKNKLLWCTSYTACFQKDETRNGRTECRTESESRIIIVGLFSKAHYNRNMDFDHSEFCFAFR